MQNVVTEQNTDFYLQKLSANSDVEGYILFNKDGIVLWSQSKSLNENQIN